MPRKKKETLVHLDMDELTQTTNIVQNTNHVQSLGNMLKKERQKKHWDIQDVSNLSCIKPIYIEALEEGRYYTFPAKAYAVGFLRTYSKLLGLNTDEMVELFHRETSDVKEEPLDMLVIEKKAALPSKKTLLISVLILVVFYVVWYFIANSYSPDTLEQENIPVSETVQEPSVPNVVEEEVIVETQPEKKEVTKKADIVIGEISEDVYTAPIAFVATERVWVRIKDNQKNVVLLDKVMAKNEHYIPKVPLENLSVSTARGGVLDLYLNGIRTQTFKKEDNTPLIGLTKD